MILHANSTKTANRGQELIKLDTNIFSFRMASAENDIPTEMQDRGKWYGDAADYWKVRD